MGVLVKLYTIGKVKQFGGDDSIDGDDNVGGDDNIDGDNSVGGDKQRCWDQGLLAEISGIGQGLLAKINSVSGVRACHQRWIV